ncbi:MAG: transposase, partial [Candidatus Rhabdochlamydia oedothoracis]|nr:transposase [Candidatus Rhabdochlamydia oedothoracis]
EALLNLNYTGKACWLNQGQLEQLKIYVKEEVPSNAAYYRSKIVADYLKTSRVEIKFLPPYSPDLNLIERLWRFMNKKVRNNRYYEKFLDFNTAIYAFFENIPKYREELQPLLSRKFCLVKS